MRDPAIEIGPGYASLTLRTNQVAVAFQMTLRGPFGALFGVGVSCLELG